MPDLSRMYPDELRAELVRARERKERAQRELADAAQHVENVLAALDAACRW